MPFRSFVSPLLVLLFAIPRLLAEEPAVGARPWLELEPVWSGHPVGFCLLSHPPYQFAAYYDAARRMTVARRRLGETGWSFTRLPSTLGWDSHNDVTMAVDRDGHLHVSGNMHGVPLVYFRTNRAGDPESLEPAAMTGDRERRVTYPVFLRDQAGRLVFRYRDGGSGNGDDLYNVYDERTRSWSRLVNGPLLSGEGKRNAYATTPVRGPDGRFHMVWVWRDTPDCATNHHLSYARSDDLVRWTDSAGRPLRLPITLATGDVIDPVPPRGGLLNVNRRLGFDNAGRPVITYHKNDAAGDLQIYAARREADGWVIRQVSNWTGYRWDFSGGGSIIVEVHVGEVRPLGGGRLALDYRYPKGSGTWVLNEATLAPIPGGKVPTLAQAGPPAAAWPAAPAFPGMERRRAGDLGDPADGREYFLTWHSLPAHRDRPREGPPPPPAALRLLWRSS
ncbi:MAG: BNR repeat-containing protein [Akkermansiaceae bacterium]|nr:BNR repeat-containing protein [Akkermansiaceae bacterium]